MLCLPSVCCPVRIVYSTHLLNQCQEHRLSARKFGKLCRGHHLPRATGLELQRLLSTRLQEWPQHTKGITRCIWAKLRLATFRTQMQTTLWWHIRTQCCIAFAICTMQSSDIVPSFQRPATSIQATIKRQANTTASMHRPSHRPNIITTYNRPLNSSIRPLLRLTIILSSSNCVPIRYCQQLDPSSFALHCQRSVSPVQLRVYCS